MVSRPFNNKRRQIYLGEESYRNTITHIESENSASSTAGLTQEDVCVNREMNAFDHWVIFRLKYTAGESLTELADLLDKIVFSYKEYVESLNELSDDRYRPPFIMNDMFGTYVDYLNLLCAAILLRREDLIARICALNDGTDFDQSDAVLEELLKFFLPDRPTLDHWIWDKPYSKLLGVIDSETPDEMAKNMKSYVKTWYSDVRGIAHFWGKHEQIKPDYTPYYGYWAMCAAAFTYLYDIDDSAYRDETVYPKDLVDYARSIPKSSDIQGFRNKPMRVAGGEPCPKSGVWFAPAKAKSEAHFLEGTVMPDYPDAQYGLTIWQWIGP